LGSCNTQTSGGLPPPPITRVISHFFTFSIFKNPYRMRLLAVCHFLRFFAFFAFFTFLKCSKPYNSRLLAVCHGFFVFIS
jgi:hypothetical protein